MAGIDVGNCGAIADDVAVKVPGVAKVVAQLSDSDLSATHPERVLEIACSSHDLLVHLHGHLNFHLGQIDYLRRILTEGSAVAFAGL